MTDRKSIHDFAVKWYTIFRERKGSNGGPTDSSMEDDCAALGFHGDHEEGETIMDGVPDIPLLLSAISSRWRRFHQGEMPEDRTWFLQALRRLALLTGEKPVVFQGVPRQDSRPEAGDEEEQRLSLMARDAPGMDDLFVFDGKRKPDRIDRISLDYHHISKIRPKDVPEGEIHRYVTWDRRERVVIDRKSETLEHIRTLGSGCVISEKYFVQEGIGFFLDDIDADALFFEIERSPDGVVDDPLETKNYRLTLDFKQGPQRVISGIYDERTLPEAWNDFITRVGEFMSFYGHGELFSPEVPEREEERDKEFTYCSVVFDGGRKSYYYLSDDDTIEVGDRVIVPVGRGNHHSVGKVVKKEFFSESEVPLPLESTKHIIRKCPDGE